MGYEKLIQLLAELHAETGKTVPATEFFSEGWLLRVLLSSYKENSDSKYKFFKGISGSKMCSEAQIRSPFKGQTKNTNADNIVGDFKKRRKTGIAISDNCRKLLVIEAKLRASTAKDTKNTDMDQITRTVGCVIREVIESGTKIKEIKDIFVVVIYPRTTKIEKLNKSQIGNLISNAEVKSNVKTRWIEEWRLVFRKVRIRYVTWGAVIKNDFGKNSKIYKYYDKCKVFSR